MSAFCPLLVPSFCAGSFLVFLLSVLRHILLAQLFSRSWFCLVRRSTAAARVWTCLSRAVVRSSSPWLLMVVAIVRVSTIQLFVWEVISMAYLNNMFPIDGANWCCREITSKPRDPHALETIPAQHKRRRPNKEHRCGAGQIPSDGQVNEKCPF